MAESPAPDTTKQRTMSANQTVHSATITGTDGEFNSPTEDPYNKAIGYLERHNILQLFQNLTSDVIYHRPDDPLDYLIKEVQNMKQQKESEKSSGK